MSRLNSWFKNKWKFHEARARRYVKEFQSRSLWIIIFLMAIEGNLRHKISGRAWNYRTDRNLNAGEADNRRLLNYCSIVVIRFNIIWNQCRSVKLKSRTSGHRLTFNIHFFISVVTQHVKISDLIERQQKILSKCFSLLWCEKRRWYENKIIFTFREKNSWTMKILELCHKAFYLKLVISSCSKLFFFLVNDCKTKFEENKKRTYLFYSIRMCCKRLGIRWKYIN